MELKSLPYVYSLMGIITVLCKGFILLCSMHKDVLSLMISRAVIHLFLQGKLNHCSCSCWVRVPASACFTAQRNYTENRRVGPRPALRSPSAGKRGPLGFSLICARVSPLGLRKKWQNVHLLFYTKSGRLPAPAPPVYLLVSGESHWFTFLLCIWCFYPLELMKSAFFPKGKIAQ